MKCYSPISDIEIYSYSFQPIDSRMFVVLDADRPEEAVVIDPCVSEEAEELLRNSGVKSITVLLTHEHYDHISGLNWIRGLFPCNVVANLSCSEAIQSPAKNRSKFFPVLFINRPQEVQDQIRRMHIQSYACEPADTVFEDRFEFRFGKHIVSIRTKAGHSNGSVCILIDDACLFSGDTLLRTVPVLRKPEGNRKAYFEDTLPWLMRLGKEIFVYPGHGECGKITDMYIYQEGNA